jgi:hypothetical protein
MSAANVYMREFGWSAGSSAGEGATCGLERRSSTAEQRATVTTAKWGKPSAPCPLACLACAPLDFMVKTCGVPS